MKRLICFLVLALVSTVIFANYYGNDDNTVPVKIINNCFGLIYSLDAVPIPDGGDNFPDDICIPSQTGNPVCTKCYAVHSHWIKGKSVYVFYLSKLKAGKEKCSYNLSGGAKMLKVSNVLLQASTAANPITIEIDRANGLLCYPHIVG